jgi:hypothetical protein
LHSTLPWTTTSGPWKPLGVAPLHALMMRFPPTVTLPVSRAELQLFASTLPSIVDGSV